MNFPKHNPKKIEFVEQRRKTDCGIACLAMLTKKMYDEITTLFPNLKKTKDGLYPDEIFDALEDLNYNYKEVSSLPTKGVALIAIQWKTSNLSGHYVIWDSERNEFLDPLHGIIRKNDFLKCAVLEYIWRIIK